MSKGKKKTQEEFIQQVHKYHPEFIILSEYEGSFAKVEVLCKKCGMKFSSIGSSLSSGKGCKVCQHNPHRLSIEEIEKRLHKNNPNIEIIEGSYKTQRSKLKFKCKIDEHEWVTTSGDVINGRRGCPECKKRTLREFYIDSHENFINKITKINPDIEILSIYNGVMSPIKCRCLKCNFEWETVCANLLYSESGCPNCSSSKGERKIKNILDESHIQYTPQKSFVDNKSPKGRTMPYDFFLPEYNLLIEYQGKQHYISQDFFGGDETFEYQQMKDNLKRKYAEINNYNYLEISYKEYDNIQEILFNKMAQIERR